MSKNKGKIKINLRDVVELKKYEDISDPSRKNPALAVTIDSDLRLAVYASYKLTKDIYHISEKDKKKKKSKRVFIPYHHRIIKKTWEMYRVLMPIINDSSMPTSEGIRMMEISLLYSFMSMMSNSMLVNVLTSSIPVLIAPSRIMELKPAILKNIIAVSEYSKEWYDEMNIDFIHDEDDDVIDDNEDDEEIGDLIVSGFEKKFEEAKERARKKIREMEDSMAPVIPIVDPSTEEGKSFLKEHSTPLSVTDEDEITEKDKEFLREHAPDKSTAVKRVNEIIKANSLKFNEVFEIYFSDLNEKAQKRLLEFVGISSPSEAWDTTLPIAVCEKDSDPNGNCTCTLVGWWAAPVEPEEANEDPDADK